MYDESDTPEDGRFGLPAVQTPYILLAAGLLVGGVITFFLMRRRRMTMADRVRSHVSAAARGARSRADGLTGTFLEVASDLFAEAKDLVTQLAGTVGEVTAAASEQASELSTAARRTATVAAGEARKAL